MNLLLLLDMAAEGGDDRIAVQFGSDTLTARDLLRRAWSASAVVGQASALAFVGTNGLDFPVALFAAAAARVPFSPLNYRLGPAQLHENIVRLGTPLVIVADAEIEAELSSRGHRVMGLDAFHDAAAQGSDVGDVPVDGEGPAVLLFTSGTTAAPKVAVLRHRHLTSYVLGTVEFSAADVDDAVLVSVPPYHVAGLANLLSNLYGGRRIIYLDQFDAEMWVATVRAEQVTNAMVVPTMMSRIADVLAADATSLPSLSALAYGGSRTPATVLRRLMDLLPDTRFTNAYGLTETSSTIAVLGPDDHQAARAGDPVAIDRLASAGRILPTVELEVRDGDRILTTGAIGEVWVRGEQVSGEYDGADSVLDENGWFPTRDRGWLDADGYLFVEGRSDDTIIRGGENIAPAEIEEVLMGHESIADCAVVGVADEEWGQRIAAFIVVREGAALDADAVREFARRSLRGSKTPHDVHLVDALPYTETGKLLRRQLPDLLAADRPAR